MEIGLVWSLAPAAFFAVVGIGLYGWLRILKETNALLKEQNLELKCHREELQVQYDAALERLSSLQAQVDVLKSIPLNSIENTLASIVNINDLILKRLEESAATLKVDNEAAAKAAREAMEKLNRRD